jgi:hypothetical protein
MTMLKLALLKLNLNRHQVAFWEAKIQHAITLAATTEQFDRHSLSSEKNLVSKELVKLELVLKNQIDVAAISNQWNAASPQTRILVNFEIRHFLKYNTVFEDLDLHIIKNQRILLRAIKAARVWLKSKRGLSDGVKATEIIYAVATIYREITHKSPVIDLGQIRGNTIPSNFEQLLLAALREGNIDIKAQSVRKLYSKVQKTDQSN